MAGKDKTMGEWKLQGMRKAATFHCFEGNNGRGDRFLFVEGGKAKGHILNRETGAGMFTPNYETKVLAPATFPAAFVQAALENCVRKGEKCFSGVIVWGGITIPGVNPETPFFEPVAAPVEVEENLDAIVFETEII